MTPYLEHTTDCCESCAAGEHLVAGPDTCTCHCHEIRYTAPEPPAFTSKVRHMGWMRWRWQG